MDVIQRAECHPWTGGLFDLLQRIHCHFHHLCLARVWLSHRHSGFHADMIAAVRPRQLDQNLVVRLDPPRPTDATPKKRARASVHQRAARRHFAATIQHRCQSGSAQRTFSGTWYGGIYGRQNRRVGQPPGLANHVQLGF